MRRHLVWAIALVLASVSLAPAQETTSGSLTGTVTDAQGAPVPGVTISVVSAQGTKTFVTDGSGRFFAPFLTPGRYNLRAELTGFSPVEQKNIDVRLGQRLDVAGLVLKVGGLEEVVEVVGTAPTIDTSSTTVGGTLDSDAMERLPVGRNFTATLYLVPGVSISGVGSANPSVGGASGLENNYVVDGVNITNSGYGAVGSYSIIFGSLGSGVTTDFIKETQVKTAGFEAEYGQATGGVVNVVTKSGTNNFHGSVFGYFSPDSLESDFNQLDTPNGTVNTIGRQDTDFGITVGGPLMREKLFFFGAFNPQYQTVTFTAPTGFPLASRGGIDRKRKIMSYAGKLTWQANSNHRFDATAFGDPADGELGPQRFTVLRNTTDAAFSEITYGGHNQVLKYDGILSANWLIEASVARAINNITETPPVNEWQIVDRTVVPNVRTGGIGFYEQGNSGKNLQFQLKSTNIFKAAGNHQFRYGVAYEDIKYDNINQRTGPTFALANGVQTATGAQIDIINDATFGRIYRVIRANLNEGRQTEQKYLSAFLQDTWEVGNKLTLRPGVRWERQRLIGGTDPAICHEDDSPGQHDGVGAAAPCEFTFSGNWGPRLGATYDIKGNGKSKLFASWGRFFAKIPNDLAARALSADAGVQRADYFDAALTRPVPAGTLAGGQTNHLLFAGLGAAEIDPDAKSTYQDEFAGGIEVEIARNLNFGVRYIQRSMPRVLEDVGTAAFVLYDQGHPALDSVEYFITNPRDGYPATLDNVGAFEDPVHDYKAVEVTANRTFADNWSLMSSYRWSRLTGNFEGFFRNDNGQSDPAISSLFDFPTNDPTYSTIGARDFGYRGDVRYLGCSLGCSFLPNDRTHQLKIYGNRAFGPLNLGVGFNAGSGQPLTALAANPNYQSSGEIPEGIRGSGIETVDGFKTRSPNTYTLDGHVDYGFKFGERRMVLIADVFNIADSQTATNYDNYTETAPGVSNPNYGFETNGGGSSATSYQNPRRIRFGARFEW